MSLFPNPLGFELVLKVAHFFVDHTSSNIYKQHDLVLYNTNKNYLHMSSLLFLFHEGLKSSFINLHGIILW